jgi:hypothetical protein
MTKRQIPKPLYVKAMKAFKTLSPTSKLPAVNQALRGLGLTQEDIDIFWTSNLEVRSWKSMEDSDHRRLNNEYEATMGPDDPIASNGDDFWAYEATMLGTSPEDEKEYRAMRDIADGDAL